jgi:hypothetical protein
MTHGHVNPSSFTRAKSWIQRCIPGGALPATTKIAVAILWQVTLSALFADPLDQWFWRNPLPQGNSLASVVFAQGRFVAVGQGGSILTSSNGTNWTLRTSPTVNSLANVAYLNDRFVAVGEKGTILTSADGADWTTVASGVTNTLTSSAYGNGSYVIVGYQGTVLWSSTGSGWSKLSGIATSLYLNSVTFGAGTFIAITSLGQVIQSWDGFSWYSETSLGGYPSQVAYLNGRFIIMDETMWSSADGLAWTSTWVNPAPEAVTFANGSYIGVGSGGIIQVSANSTNWTWATGKGVFGRSRGNRLRQQHLCRRRGGGHDPDLDGPDELVLPKPPPEQRRHPVRTRLWRRRICSRRRRAGWRGRHSGAQPASVFRCLDKLVCAGLGQLQHAAGHHLREGTVCSRVFLRDSNLYQWRQLDQPVLGLVRPAVLSQLRERPVCARRLEWRPFDFA